MISCLGFYLTRSGQTVHITKIYQSQPVAEGWLFDGSEKTYCHIWNTSGEFSRKGEHKNDIIKFMYFSDPNENSYE